MSQRPETAPVISTMPLPDVGNLHGGVFGGWIASQCDLAAGLAGRRHGGPCVTKAIQEMVFHAPLLVGDGFQLFAQVVKEGRSSMTIELEGWREPLDAEPALVVTARFVMVCVDEQGQVRALTPR